VRGLQVVAGHCDPIKVIPVETLLIIIALVAIFEYAAARWGYDSRESFRIRRG
jgi:hypothetical protein